MTYEEVVAGAASSYRDQIAESLDADRARLRRARGEVAELEQSVAFLERLLAMGDGGSTNVAAVDMTLHDAMAAVLNETPGHRLRPSELVAEINRRGLYRMRDGRAVEAQQIHARVGHYSHLFAKQDGFIVLRSPES